MTVTQEYRSYRKWSPGPILDARNGPPMTKVVLAHQHQIWWPKLVRGTTLGNQNQSPGPDMITDKLQIVVFVLGHSNIIHCFSSPTSSGDIRLPNILRHYLHLRNLFTNYIWSLGGNYASTVYCTHVFGSFGASTVCTCSTFSMLSKTMVSHVLECNRSAQVHDVQQCRQCCFDVYKLHVLMSNDIDRPPASWSICCGDEKQWIILEWPYEIQTLVHTVDLYPSLIQCVRI